MCARLLSCPLCSQPGFGTLDGLRAGLVSVATRPLACPVCNETLLGIDKLTIHLFGHTINSHDRSKADKAIEVNCENALRDALTRNKEIVSSQNWSPASLPIDMANEKINFTSLSNGETLQSDSTLVINKEHSSLALDNLQSCRSISESRDDRSNEIIFLRDSRLQQFCTPTLIHLEHSSARDTSAPEVYPNMPAMMSNSANANDAVGRSISLQNCQERSDSQSDGAIYRQTVEEAQKDSTDDASRREEKSTIVPQDSDAWIENLLTDNNEKILSTANTRRQEEKSSFSISSLPNVEGKYFEKYNRARTSLPSNGNEIMTVDTRVNGPDSNAGMCESEETFNSDGVSCSNGNDKVLLSHLKAFRLVAMNGKTERCDICGCLFIDKNFLILHKRIVHMIADKDLNSKPEEFCMNYPCHLCSKIFKTRGHLMVHMRLAHFGYSLGCLSKDKESESTCCENSFNCPTCGKNFKKEQHVTQHLKTHEGKQWECDICSKMFTTKYFLKKHKRLHSGEMPYKCTLCDKTFTFQQSFHKHRLYHKDDKPHTCGTCGRSFKELSTLHNHERIHTGEKPFVCETCGKCFRQRVSYLVHRRIHTGVMPYKCTACGKSFRYKVSQRTHKCSAQPGAQDLVGSTSESPSVRNTADCMVDTQNSSSSLLIKNQRVSELSTNENNKFILIVNTEGQPILTREADVGSNGFIDDKKSLDTLDTDKVNRELRWKDDFAQHDNVTNGSATLHGRECNAIEKCSGTDANDFFSLVMSPLESDLSSPSTEMQHLRLSSPTNEETIRQNESIESSETVSNNVSLQRDCNNAIGQIFNDNSSTNSPLQTINEESFKQLLYGMDRK